MPDYTKPDLIKMVQDAAIQYGVPANILAAMIQQESGWSTDPSLTSKAGARGIAQFMPDTARQYGIDPTDPAQSIYGAAHYLSDLGKQINHGQAIDPKDKEATKKWEVAAVAYNSGVGNVQKAISTATNNFKPDSWLDELQKITGTDEGTRYYNAVSGKSGPGGDAATLARQNPAYKGSKPTTSGVATPSTPGTLQPPNITDFQTDDGNGGKVTDTAGYYKAWNDYVQTQQAQQKLQSGPLAQYVNDTISDITQQIEAGKLDVSKANNLLTAKISAFKDANDVYSSDAFRYGAPVGATTAPSTNIPISGGVTMNPLQQALDISNQAQGLFSGMQTPTVPSISSIISGYEGQYGGSVPNSSPTINSVGGVGSQSYGPPVPTGPAPNPLLSALQGVNGSGFPGAGTPPPPPPPPPIAGTGASPYYEGQGYTQGAIPNSPPNEVYDKEKLAYILANGGLGAPN